MKINWKIRLRNKTFWFTMAGIAVPFIYTTLGLFGVVPSISENNTIDLVLAGLNMLAAVGIIIDPTTTGVADSSRALTYEQPKENILCEKRADGSSAIASTSTQNEEKEGKGWKE